MRWWPESGAVEAAFAAPFALAVFGRAPIAGTTKTRLIPALGADGAARLYAGFLADALALARRAHLAGLAEVTLWTAQSPDEPPLLAVAGASEVRRRPQAEGDLGLRMSVALSAGVASHGRALVLGSDAPTLPFSLVQAACAALERADLVFCPAADGGYVLIGARVVVPPVLFDGARFSTPHALADTLAGAARLGFSIARTNPWYDVDTPDDLRTLRTHLLLAPAAAPFTAQALAALGGGS